MSNKFDLLDKITSCEDEGNAMDIVKLDFGKGFEKVPHDLIIHKLEKCGKHKTTTWWATALIPISKGLL